MAYELNNAVIAGRLARDPEVRYTAGEHHVAIAQFTVAVDRGKETADYITCRCIGKNAEFVEKHRRKGDAVALTGIIRTGSYKRSRDGRTIYTMDVDADTITSEKKGNLKLNIVVIEGRLTRDPDVRTTANGAKMARFTLAVNRPFNKRIDKTEDETDYISCAAYQENADLVEKLFKGTAIAVIGAIRTGSYTREDGEKVYTKDVVADTIRYATVRDVQSEEGQSGYGYSAQTPMQDAAAQGFAEAEQLSMEGVIQGDYALPEDLPFT